MGKQTVEDFIKENGYKAADYVCDWNGYKCYSPYFEKGIRMCVGLPVFVLEDANGDLRYTTKEEAFKIIDEIDDEEDDEEE